MVLYVSWWNKVYTEPDYFLGYVRLPLASINVLRKDEYNLHPLTITGT